MNLCNTILLRFSCGTPIRGNTYTFICWSLSWNLGQLVQQCPPTIVQELKQIFSRHNFYSISHLYYVISYYIHISKLSYNYNLLLAPLGVISRWGFAIGYNSLDDLNTVKSVIKRCEVGSFVLWLTDSKVSLSWSLIPDTMWIMRLRRAGESLSIYAWKYIN